MIKSVAKHKYIKGKNGLVRGRAHINYIAHRGGQDRELGGRKFFNREREDIDASEVKRLFFEKADRHGVTMHKLILSPGLDADAKEYTREIMQKIEQDKGLDLEWHAVVHENTEHRHAHVVIMGKDKNGRLVRFDGEDYKQLRRFGDEYLDREHKLDRYLDREMHDLLRSKEYDRGGDSEFRRLVFGGAYEPDRDRDKRKREQDPDRERREFEKFDQDMRRAIENMKSSDLYAVRGEQRVLEQAGRLAEHHSDYAMNMAKERLNRIAEEQPELAESIKEELLAMRSIVQDGRLAPQRDREVENLLGFNGESRQERQHDFENGVSASTTFEIDRIMRSEQQQGKNEESDREDDNILEAGH